MTSPNEEPTLKLPIGNFVESPPSISNEPLVTPAFVGIEPTIELHRDAIAGKSISTSIDSQLVSFADYEILSEIARGGMGVVYKARQKGLNRTVALKMILAGSLASSADVKRFQAEAAAAAALEHSGIVPIYEIGERAGQHFFSMAFVDGQSLQTRLKDGPLPAREAAELILVIAEAVQYAHSKGIVHRDLKPHNILLDSTGQPKVTDFGLAKRLDHQDGLTNTGDVLGTPSYMAPEQALGKVSAIGPRTDVYALGAILYAGFAGRPPFQAASLTETLRQVCEQEPVSPRLFYPQLPLDLETICLKCLEKSPSRRYESAQALADELQRFLRGEPILARPISSPARAWRWCKRNPTVASLTSVIALSLVAGAVVAWVLASWALQEAEVSKAKEAIAVRELQISEMFRLAAESRAHRTANPVRSTLLAIAAIERAPPDAIDASSYVENELRECLSLLGGWPLPETSISLARSPDGKGLVLGGALWNAEDAKPFDELLTLPALQGKICYACSVDGHWLAAGDDQGASLWDLTAKDFATTSPVRLETENAVSCLEFSADGRWLATGGRGTKLWDLKKVVPQPQSIVLGADDEVHCLAISPNSRWLVTGGHSGPCRRWDLQAENPATAMQLFYEQGQKYQCAADRLSFSPDGKWLAMSHMSFEDVNLWNFSKEPPAPEPIVLRGHEFYVSSQAMSPDGHWLATGGEDNTARLWDLTKLDPSVNPRVLRSHEGAVNTLAFSGDGHWLVTSNSNTNETTRLWDLSNEPGVVPRRLEGADTVVAISTDERWLATGGRQPQVWDLAADNPAIKPRELGGHEQPVKRLAFSHDGHWLATAGDDATPRVWDLTAKDAGTEPRILRGHGGPIDHLTMDAAGRRIATAERDGAIHLWDLSSSNTAAAARILPKQLGHLGCITLSPNGRWLTMETIDFTTGKKATWLLNVEEVDSTAKLLVANCSSSSFAISGIVAFSRDNRSLVAADDKSTVWLYDLTVADPLVNPRKLFAKDEFVFCVAISDNGQTLATSNAGFIRIWDLTQADPAASSRLLQASEGTVNQLTLSGDGRWLATGEMGFKQASVRVMDLTDHTPDVTAHVLRGTSILSLAHSTKSRWLATADGESARLWDLSRERLIALGQALADRQLSDQERKQFRLTNRADQLPAAISGENKQATPNIELRDALPAWPTSTRFHLQLAEKYKRRAGQLFIARFHAQKLVQREPQVKSHQALLAEIESMAK